MPRLPLVGLASIVVLAAMLAVVRPAPVRAPTPQVAARSVGASVVRTPSPQSDAVFSAQSAEVEAACDLDLEIACEDGFCAALTVMPDLDRAAGWLALTVQRPRFVLSTVLRDLGVPPTVLPCGSALADLVGDRPVPAVELPDGTELWCTSSGAEAEGLAWCAARAAAELGVDVAFDAPSLRRLSFDR